MARLFRFLLLRILPVLLLLEVGFRIEWYVRDRMSQTVAQAGAVHLLAFGNSLTAGYPRFLRAEIVENLPGASVVVEQLVKGSTPSNQLVRLLETRLAEGPIDVVIALMGAFDHRVVELPPVATGDPPDVEAEPSPSLKPMFVGVLRGSFESWFTDVGQLGIRGLLRPDLRAAQPVFQRGPARSSDGDDDPGPAAEAFPEPEWGGTADSRRVVATGDTLAVAEGFAQVLASGWDAAVPTNEFRTAKQWYRVISGQEPRFIEEVARHLEGLDAPGALPLMRYAITFSRGDYDTCFRMDSELPYSWFSQLGIVHAARASREQFDAMLAATIRVRGANSAALRMKIAHLTEHGETGEAVEFLRDVLLRRWPEIEPSAAERSRIDRMAQKRVLLLLAARSECARVEQFGLPDGMAAELSSECLSLETVSPRADFFTDVTRRSYQRLLELSREHDFAIVAVQYPGRPVDELVDYLPSGFEFPIVDNHASFVAAVEEHTHLGVYTNYARVGRAGGGHLTALGGRLLARNIFEVLLAAELLPSGRDQSVVSAFREAQAR